MGTEEPCCCQSFLAIFPTAPTIDGHVVVDGLYTGLSHSAKTIFQSNGSNAFFPGKEQFLATATTCLEEWLTDHGLTWDIVPEFQDLVQAEWETHLQQVHPDALRWGDVVAFRKTYADFIFHCEDHEPKKLVAYCRQFYAEALNRTFRYQLTAIGRSAPGLYIAEEVTDGRFLIAGGEPGTKVSWQVTGVRQDAWAQANRIEVEPVKSGAERGTYLHPELYGQPEEARTIYGNSIERYRATFSLADEQ